MDWLTTAAVVLTLLGAIFALVRAGRQTEPPGTYLVYLGGLATILAAIDAWNTGNLTPMLATAVATLLIWEGAERLR